MISTAEAGVTLPNLPANGACALQFSFNAYLAPGRYRVAAMIRQRERDDDTPLRFEDKVAELEVAYVAEPESAPPLQMSILVG